MVYATPQRVRRAASDAMGAARANRAYAKLLGEAGGGGERAGPARLWAAPLRRALAKRGRSTLAGLEPHGECGRPRS